MSESSSAAELRAALVEYRKHVRRGGYSAVLRQQGVGYVERRLAEGGRYFQIAKEVGVSVATVRDWAGAVRAGRAKPEAACEQASPIPMIPVVVRANEPSRPPARLEQMEVEFPGGVRLRRYGVSEDVWLRTLETLGGRR